MWGKHDKIKKNMVKNHESVSNQSESGAENQWSDLEKIGESGLKVEVNPASIHEEITQEAQESKATKLNELSKKIKDVYKATKQQSRALNPQVEKSEISPAPPDINKNMVNSGSLIDRIKAIYYNRQSSKSVALIQKLSNSKKSKDESKLSRLAESGKINFADQRVSEAFLETVRDVRPNEITRLTELGISPELIQQNENIQSLTIQAFRSRIDESLNGKSYRSDGLGDAPVSYSNEILIGLISDERKKEQLTQGLDIQRYGDEVVDKSLGEMQKYYYDSEYNKEYRKNAATNLSILKQLGFMPSSSDMQVVKLFDGDSPDKKQEVASEVGLIDGKVVDRMYAYKYEQTLRWIRNEDEQAKLPELTISQKLAPSEDGLGSYWHEQSRVLGKDAMVFCAKYIKDEFEREYKQWEDYYRIWYPDRPEPKLEDYIKDGTLQDKFFEDGGQTRMPMDIVKYSFWGESDGFYHGGYSESIMKFLASNIDSIHGENRGFISTWAKIQGKDEQTTAEARLAFMQYVTGDQNINNHFFDNYGPSKNFFSHALDRIDIKQILPLIDENWQGYYSSSELAYMDFLDRNPGFLMYFDSNKMDFQGAVNEYFSQDGPNQNLAKAMLESRATQLVENPEILSKLPEEEWPILAEKILNTNPKQLVEHPEVITKLPLVKQQYINFLRANDFPDSASGFKSDDIEKFFGDSGPKPDFWAYEFTHGDFETILRQDEEAVKEMPFDNKQSTILETYNSIEDGILKSDFKNFVMEGYEEVPISRIAFAPTILNRLGQSNASEITAHRSAFAQQLLRINLDDDQKMFESLERIEDVFIHNNLPFVGKAFLSFQILHPQFRLDSDFEFGEESTISPVLKKAAATEKDGGITSVSESREAIIFSDLLRASFGSNNRSIKEYLKTIQKGQNLVDELKTGQMGWDRFKSVHDGEMAQDAKSDYDALNIFAQHMNTMYNNTRMGRDNPRRMTGDIRQDITELTAAFSSSERHSLADRIVRSFAYFADITDFDSATSLLAEKTSSADKRNREAVMNRIRLEQGDFIKGIGSVGYLSNILQNGSVAKEFLGDSAGSDRTPLDTDLSVILEQPSGIEDGLNKTDANDYGPVWLVLKGDENRAGEKRFSITRRSPSEFNQTVEVPGSDGIEAFYTGVLGPSHYGIRTGFGSSEIDYFVTDNGSTNGTLNSQTVGLEVALNGFYIPVVDKSSGEVVFSPNDYDALRRRMSGLSYYETGDYQFASDTDLRFGATEINGDKVDSIDSIISKLAQNEQEVRKKHKAIDGVIDDALGEIGGLTRKNYIDGDLTEGFVELVDTGSTGRFDNAPGSGDFDYMMRVDKSIMDNPAKLGQISNALLAKFGKTKHAVDEVLENGNLRLKGVSIEGLDTSVDIDISFTQKTNKVQYSTDMALADRLENIKKQSPEKHQQVVANIIFAKQFLKSAGSYKPNRGETPQGGLGGVGVENWVLQNGGSFLSAAKEFMSVAEKCENFEEFKAKYAVWDFGENHMSKGERQHDNFVSDNMSADGYKRMKQALVTFLQQV